jgi:hypothetical protein
VRRDRLARPVSRKPPRRREPAHAARKSFPGPRAGVRPAAYRTRGSACRRLQQSGQPVYESGGGAGPGGLSSLQWRGGQATEGPVRGPAAGWPAGIAQRPAAALICSLVGCSRARQRTRRGAEHGLDAHVTCSVTDAGLQSEHGVRDAGVHDRGVTGAPRRAVFGAGTARAESRAHGAPSATWSWSLRCGRLSDPPGPSQARDRLGQHLQACQPG